MGHLTHLVRSTIARHLMSKQLNICQKWRLGEPEARDHPYAGAAGSAHSELYHFHFRHGGTCRV